MSFMDNIGGTILGGAFKLGGAALDRRANESASNKNRDWQKKFAKKGIQWRVEDAKKAGIHPLYAMGAQTHSFNPVQVGSTFGQALGDMGQDISRAMYANADAPTRAQAKAMQALQMENQSLQNDKLRAEIAKLSGQVGPPVPSGAQSLGLWEQKPAEVTASRPGASHISAGPAGPAYTEADFGPFKLNLLSSPVSEQLEDMEALKYWLMYKGNESQVDDYIAKKAEPYFSTIYEYQRAIEDAIDGVQSWANSRRRDYRNAKNRSFNQRRGSWGREAR